MAPFPHWVRCPFCSLIAPLDSGVFKLKANYYRPDMRNMSTRIARRQAELRPLRPYGIFVYAMKAAI